MTRFTAALCLGIMAMLAGGAAMANRSQPVRLSPSSDWHIDYADDSCRLGRQFGEGEQRILLVFDRFEPGESFRLSLYGRPLSRVRSGRDTKYQFGPAEIEQSTSFREARANNVPAMLFNGSLRIAPLTSSGEDAWRERENSGDVRLADPALLDPAREAAIAYLRVEAPGLSPMILETGSMRRPFDALRQCIDELLSHWEIDVEKHRSLTRRATPTRSPTTWVSSNDYPGEALRRGEGAIVHFRLIVDAQGQVRDCRIQRSTEGEAFKTAVCNAISRRARFEPALDAEGNPIQSYYVNTVSFIVG